MPQVDRWTVNRDCLHYIIIIMSLAYRVEYLYRYRTGRYFFILYRTGADPIQAEPRVP